MTERDMASPTAAPTAAAATTGGPPPGGPPPGGAAGGPPRRPGARDRRRGRWALALLALLVLLALLLATTLALLRSPAGSQWLLARVPGVELEGAQGSPLGEAFSARRLRIALPGGPGWVEAQDLAWHGARWTVAPGNGRWLDIGVEALKITRLQIRSNPASSDRITAPRSLRMPVSLDLRAWLVDELRFDGLAPLRQVSGSLQFGAGNGGRHALEIRRATWEHIDGSARFRLGADAPFPLEADTALQASTGQPWRAQLSGRGPLSSFALGATLESAEAGATGASLRGQAQIQPFEAWPLGQVNLTTRALDLSAIWPTAPRTRLSGHALVRSRGLREPVGVDIELDNAVPARLNERGLPLLALRLALRVDPRKPDRLAIGPFQLEAADAQGTAGRLSGSGTWEGGTLSLATRLLELQPQRLDHRLAPMRLTGPLQLELQGLPSPDPRATPATPWAGWASLTAEFRGRLQGHVLGAPDEVELEFDAQAAARRLELRSVKARSGAASARLEARLEGLPGARWQLRSRGELQAFDPTVWVPGSADDAWRRGPHRLNGNWQLDVTSPQRVVGAPLAQWLPALRGQGDLRIDPSRLAGLPFSANLRLRQDPQDVPAQRSRASGDLALGSARLDFEGAGDPLGDGALDRTRGRLNAPQLAELAPVLALLPTAATAAVPRQGQLDAQVEARGRWPEMGFDIKANGKDLQATAWAVAAATLQARMGRQRNEPLQLAVDAQQVRWDRLRVDRVKADLNGSLAAHRIEATLLAPLIPPKPLADALGWQQSPATALQVSGDGRWQGTPDGGGQWTGRFARLAVGAANSGAATGSGAGAVDASWLDAKDLQAELNVDAGGQLARAQFLPGELSSGALRLRWSEAVWQAAGRGEPDSWRLQARSEPLEVAAALRRLEAARAGTTAWGGDLLMGASLDIRAASTFEADIRLQRQGGDLWFADGGARQALGLTEASATLQARDGRWHFVPRAAGTSLGRLEGDVVATAAAGERWPGSAARLDGQLRARVPAMRAWSAWLPPGWQLQGSLDGDARIAGTLGAPRYAGQVRAQDVSVRNLLAGVDLRDGMADIRLDGETARIEALRMSGGDGRLNITGEARLGAQPELQLQARAEQLRVLGRVDRQLVMSGQAQLQAARDRLRVNGQLKVDSGLIDFSRRDAPTLDDDVEVLKGEPLPAAPDAAAGDPRATRRAVQVALDVDLGQRLRLRGRGLDTGLAGNLRLTAPEGRLAVHGNVRAQDGTYAAYGQKLVIERGQVMLAGPVDAARLDILALRPNLDMRVGVAITGMVTDPRVRLYSETDMSETEKLSWLVLGRGSDGLGRTDTALLQRAALALLAGEGDAPSDKLVRALGLDDFSIRQSDGDVRETVVSVGKQLSRRWYVGYERGVNATSGTWQLIYRIAQRFTLRAQSGDDNSLDLIWTWRFGTVRDEAPAR